MVTPAQGFGAVNVKFAVPVQPLPILAPKDYALDIEAKAIFLDSCEEESWEAVMDGAWSCPVAANIIYDETGKQIFP